MNKHDKTKKSKFLSYVLRHHPDTVGISLDEQGWVAVEELLQGCRNSGEPISMAELLEIVETSPKKRFALSRDRRHIRANQGHSVDVDLAYEPVRPPGVLYHGTVAKFLPAIRKDGLKRMSRHHVHLSPDRGTAVNVGGRRGKPMVLKVDAEQMHLDGYVFFKTDNNVWLTEHVPTTYLSTEGDDL